jgi:hypothetical protein
MTKLFVNANEKKFVAEPNSRRTEHQGWAEHSLGNFHCMSSVIRYGVNFTSRTTWTVRYWYETDVAEVWGCFGRA